MTKEKLREIIDYKNSNSEKLKIIKSESGQIRLSLSEDKFQNIKVISEQINIKVLQLENLISD
jgi:16S rRNA U516 pseudouridylate synthase RsuA-like enzyme